MFYINKINSIICEHFLESLQLHAVVKVVILTLCLFLLSDKTYYNSLLTCVSTNLKLYVKTSECHDEPVELTLPVSFCLFGTAYRPM